MENNEGGTFGVRAILAKRPNLTGFPLEADQSDGIMGNEEPCRTRRGDQ